MAISKKEAEKVLVVLRMAGINQTKSLGLMVSLLESDIKNRGFRKSIKKVVKALERNEKAAVTKAA